MSLVYSQNILGSSSSGGNWYISTLPCLRSLMAGSYVKKDQGVASVISTRTRPCRFFQWKRWLFFGKTQLITGWWFQICLYFHPYFWEDFTNFDDPIFQIRWFNEATRFGWRYKTATFFYLNKTQQPGPRRLQDLYFSKYVSWLRNHFLQFL